MAAARGTSNTNVRGSAAQRRRRRQWLLDSYGDGVEVACHACGVMLTRETLTVDRIVPGVHGGTYRRDNIRPACLLCNILDGVATRVAKQEAENWVPPRHRRGCQCARCDNVAQYRLAREAAELQREAVTGSYAAEMAEYGPILTFRSWLESRRT